MESRQDAPAVADDLAASGAALRAGGPDDAVGGRVPRFPRFVATPPDPASASELMAAAARHGLAMVPRGHATKMGWGGPPERCDLVIDTRELNGIDHATGDLVVRVGAGTPMAELEAALAKAGQRLSVDTVVPGSTVGGVVATGLSGPLRMLYGPVRDLIIGMTTVRADGVTASSGGRVVKNVAGYDLGKLHTGALGTLGLVTSVTFRLHPVPPARRFVCLAAEGDDPADVHAGARALRATQVVPSAVELEWPVDGPPALRVLLEGAESGVEQRSAEVAALLGERTEVSAEPPTGWGSLPGSADDLLLQLAFPVSDLPDALAVLRAAAASAGTAVALRGSLGSGVVYAALPAAAEGAAIDAVTRLRAAHDDGWVTFPDATRAPRTRLPEAWGEIPGLPLMRAVKDRFDPDHLLAPGRIAGGV
ncbi:FAD-binding oxidoreductase [Nocardiopsis gilva YIM 90087]|uniref:FAD-binding oxidoreductase n=1 Tax=Nocardiopsis gilva YIM 90087 TaxID=1235441 RepID=A0A223S4J6_9ACTN|nr:FAD-binding oxidoreductase [Nocardiopsis gilva]ASU83054.1 FAD-binding oxidoreductase [Nocardiopsis gilva YIM 90087]